MPLELSAAFAFCFNLNGQPMGLKGSPDLDQHVPSHDSWSIQAV